MSDYKKNSSYITVDNEHYYWNDVWDSLYYNFIHDNINKFKNNYSLANAVKNWKNKSSEEKKEIIKLAHKYVDNYN